MSDKFSEPDIEYEEAFRALMLRRLREELVETRVRHLLFAVADPSCPLSYYQTNRFPAKSASYLVGQSESRKTLGGGVREELFRRSAPLGLLQSPGSQMRIRLAVPGPDEFQEINALRYRLELSALLEVPKLPKEKREDIVEALEEANKEIRLVGEHARYDNEKDLSEKLATDPHFGHRAEQFWKHDADFHTLASEKLDFRIHTELLQIVLERIRLSGANRATIIKRIPKSVRQHADIIAAVSAPRSKNSEQAIADALKAHFASSNKDFGLTQKGRTRKEEPSD